MAATSGRRRRSWPRVEFADGTSSLWSGGLQAAEVPGGLKPAAPQEPWAFSVIGNAVLFDYDEVANAKDETLDAFAERMFHTIDEHPVDRLIIDLRDNYGGNNALNRSLLHGLIRAKKLQAPGTLFVLTGRRTFSDLKENAFKLRLGTKRAAGTMTMNGVDYLVTAECNRSLSGASALPTPPARRPQ